jgi:hypothetical protein
MDWSFFFVNRNWMPQWFMWVLFLLSCCHFCTFIPHRTPLGLNRRLFRLRYFLLFSTPCFLVAFGPLFPWHCTWLVFVKLMPKDWGYIFPGLKFRVDRRFSEGRGGMHMSAYENRWNWMQLGFSFLGMSVPLFMPAYFNCLVSNNSSFIVLHSKKKRKVKVEHWDSFWLPKNVKY